MDFIKEAVKQNGHWETGRIDFPRLEGPVVGREILPGLESSAKGKFITVLRGLRRTGKSVLARELMRNAISRGRKPNSIAWFEFDRAMKASPDDLDSLLSFFQGRQAQTVVLDEIPFVVGWQDVLKRFYDRTEMKFVVTGSSALEMDERSAESLAGRFDLVLVEPFSFREYLERRGRHPPSTPLEFAKLGEGMALECDGYMRTGGLPEAIPMESAEERREYVSSSLLDPLFYKDLPAVFPGANPDMLRKTLELLSATVGSTFQFQALSQILGCSHPIAALQLGTLERSLLVRVAYNRTASVMKQRRTAKKVIFSDNGVLVALRPEIPAGALAENAVANSAGGLGFWRDAEGREVDFIFPAERLAIEVKYQEHITTADERHLHYFLERNKGWKGLMITKCSEDKSDIARMPLWKWLLSRRKGRRYGGINLHPLHVP